MSETLPIFRYHPDPVGTGSVEPSSTTCVGCGRERGFIYTGPVYAIDEFQSEICPGILRLHLKRFPVPR